ncbi:MBL fold metallo-hydrolase [Rhodobacteraceae bacterium KMM 6894]|nr:MBL fold metallo-hydrolase [Rhodobacteraceae bacterium KMM 6894]
MAQDWYKVVDLGNGITAIGEPRYHQQNWSYLICGTDRALLFDTGSYYGDIAPVVAGLTDLPLTVMPSHMHYDHLGNVLAFERIVLPDLPILRDCATGGQITPTEMLFLGRSEDRAAPTFSVAEWLPIGAEIGLGGITLHLLHTPGHSPDSVSLWWAEGRTLFAADYLYHGSLYAQVPGADLLAYRATARILHDLLPADARILGAHGDADDYDTAHLPTLTHPALADLITCLDKIAVSPPTLTDGEAELPVTPRVTLIVGADALKGFEKNN